MNLFYDNLKFYCLTYYCFVFDTVKCSYTQYSVCFLVTGLVVVQRVSRGIVLSSMTAALEGDEWSAARPGRTLPPEKTRYPLYRRLGGPQCRSGPVRKISPPPGFDLRTVQSVAQSLYRLSYRVRYILIYMY